MNDAGDKTIDISECTIDMNHEGHIGKAFTRSGSIYEIDLTNRRMRLTNPREHHKGSSHCNGEWHEYTNAWREPGDAIGFDWDGDGRGVKTSSVVKFENMTINDLDHWY